MFGRNKEQPWQKSQRLRLARLRKQDEKKLRLLRVRMELEKESKEAMLALMYGEHFK